MNAAEVKRRALRNANVMKERIPFFKSKAERDYPATYAQMVKEKTVAKAEAKQLSAGEEALRKSRVYNRVAENVTPHLRGKGKVVGHFGASTGPFAPRNDFVQRMHSNNEPGGINRHSMRLSEKEGMSTTPNGFLSSKRLNMPPARDPGKHRSPFITME